MVQDPTNAGDLKSYLNKSLKELLIYWYANTEFSRNTIYIPGTEAAAATGYMIRVNCAVRTMSFNADHPFLFMIWDHRLQVPLFIGRFMEPASTDVGDQHTHEGL
jgi:hypothetical protein